MSISSLGYKSAKSAPECTTRTGMTYPSFIPVLVSAKASLFHRSRSCPGASTSTFQRLPVLSSPVNLPGCRLPFARGSSLTTLIASAVHAPLVPVATAAQSLAGDVLESFAAAVRGEWTGFEASFDGEGKPVKVENYYVPEEFIEWGIWPTGFISTHSVIVRGTTLYHKHFRSLPTVSHFGDHVELEDELTTFDVSGADPGFMAWADGSFSAGPAVVMTSHKSILDAWPVARMVLRHEGKAVHVLVKFDFAKHELADDVRVFVERYSCIFCDGADIEGCSGNTPGFSDEDPMRPHHLAGDWTVEGAPQPTKITRPKGGLSPVPNKHVYLPKGVDVGIHADSNSSEGGVAVHVGWLVDPATRIVMSRAFHGDGTVRMSYRHTETKVQQ
jgi:hypothetical protein